MTRRKPEPKVEMPLPKQEWRPTLLAGQIVLVSTRSMSGDPHAARKSWISMVGSAPPMLALSCNIAHRSAINILETRDFVVNVPGDDIVSKVWSAGDTAAAALQADPAAWTFIPAAKVGSPRVQECRGHIECALDSTKRLNEDELIFFARIVAVSIDESLLKGSPEERYRAMRLIFFLEDDLFATLDAARKIPT